ncbi:DUF3576 domain-containing protein [Asticcacaulis taihuensis]|jgi:hypothetical protein|uniref:DUF3576 domain-containing protein n=1 Tax=Asticcacaulis taihuensis TaxID=260084 RepID=A0A1G4T0C0_9CAUL|nr:DUF3576 domain-containing protein [Asticcacaulis taihuensis]SCW74838.1 protein of unknown function [Asticcacaulis taihuensis]
MTIMRKSAPKRFGLALAALGLCLSFSACASLGTKGGTASANTTAPTEESKIDLGHLFGGGKKESANTEQAGIGVNAYLWRASLDTISFMPLTSADPWGGVIITDWYANPQTPDEHFKVTIFILDSRLRADALNVSIQKEVRAGDRWVPADVSQQTQLDIENAILTRARELRLSNVKN